jgi:hypothetical protein
MMAIASERRRMDRRRRVRAVETGYWSVISEPGRDPNVRKRPFTVRRADEDVPALIWLPERPARRRPLVLLGHGGGMHKESPLIDRLANWLAGAHGLACLAIDLPFHGERTPPQEIGLSARERRRRLGLDGWRERNSRATGQAVADWRAAIDVAQDADLRQDADPAAAASTATTARVHYVRRVPSPGDARWASVGLDV